LDAPELSVPSGTFRDAVLAEVDRLCRAIDEGEILRREDQLRVYRRVLYQARSNDTLIDDSEAAILGVLRQELDISQAEHFLIEHHADLREFWRREASFLRELHALRSAGIIYVRNDQTLLPDDLARSVRQVFGLDMSQGDSRRLYAHLTNTELHEALTAIQAPTSGSKEERIERLLRHMSQPRFVLRLRGIGIGRLREICKDIGATVSGTKDELVDRIIQHVGTDKDLVTDPEPAPRIEEPRRLPEDRFALLFSRLRGHELAALLGELELRRWGSKATQVRTLWEAHRAEATLLGWLSSSDLEAVLKRLALRSNGSKSDRIERLITHFATTNIDALVAANALPDEASAEQLTDAPAVSQTLNERL
jgi:hypothetical protein